MSGAASALDVGSGWSGELFVNPKSLQLLATAKQLNWEHYYCFVTGAYFLIQFLTVFPQISFLAWFLRILPAFRAKFKMLFPAFIHFPLLICNLTATKHWLVVVVLPLRWSILWQNVFTSLNIIPTFPASAFFIDFLCSPKTTQNSYLEMEAKHL